MSLMQFVQGADHRIVFQFCGQNPVTRLHQSMQSLIQYIGPIETEADLAGGFGPKQFSQSGSATINDG